MNFAEVAFVHICTCVCAWSKGQKNIENIEIHSVALIHYYYIKRGKNKNVVTEGLGQFLKKRSDFAESVLSQY